MTNKEAIKAIECSYQPPKYTVLREALDMAIEALEKQDQCCRNCDHRKNRDFDRYLCNKRWMWVYDDMYCSDWSEEEWD